MRLLPLLVAAAVAEAEPLAVNDVCYRFCEDCRKPFGDESGPAPQEDLEAGRPRADSAPSPMGSTAPLRRARPPPMIELQPANNDLETRVQPVEVPGDDDYTLS